MTVGDTPEQGGRDDFDALMGSVWTPAMQELDALMDYTAGNEEPSDEAAEARIQSFLQEFSELYPSYSHATYESRIEAICMADDHPYLTSPRMDWSVLHAQLAQITNLFLTEPEPGVLSEVEQQQAEVIKLHQKIKLAGDYWFTLGDDSFWLIKMLDKACTTEPQLGDVSRDVVQGYYIMAFGRKPEQDALYVQCIHEFVEEKGEEVDDELRAFFESEDPDKDAQVRSALFAIATLNAIEVFEDAFNTRGMPPGGVASRKTSAEEKRLMLRTDIATIVCAAGMTVEQMLDQSQPVLDKLMNDIFQFLYRQIMQNES